MKRGQRGSSRRTQKYGYSRSLTIHEVEIVVEEGWRVTESVLDGVVAQPVHGVRRGGGGVGCLPEIVPAALAHRRGGARAVYAAVARAGTGVVWTRTVDRCKRRRRGELDRLFGREVDIGRTLLLHRSERGVCHVEFPLQLARMPRETENLPSAVKFVAAGSVVLWSDIGCSVRLPFLGPNLTRSVALFGFDESLDLARQSTCIGRSLHLAEGIVGGLSKEHPRSGRAG